MWWRLDETPYVTKKSRIQRNGCGRIGAVFVGDSLKESLHAEDETMRVTVEKLAATEQEGDWHDRPYPLGCERPANNGRAKVSDEKS